MLKVLAFDLFGTLVNVDGYDLTEYARILDYHKNQGVWFPFRPPESWRTLPAFPDSKEGLAKLRSSGYKVILLSNCPVNVAIDILDHNDLRVDWIVPLETQHVYKPNRRSYKFAREMMDVAPEEFGMVTANESFGDLQTAQRLGMKSFLIRDIYDDRQACFDVIDLSHRLQYFGVEKATYRKPAKTR